MMMIIIIIIIIIMIIIIKKTIFANIYTNKINRITYVTFGEKY